jgi:hypothetical protein
MNKFAVILASHIPSVDKLWVGEDILKKVKEFLPKADIFVGINPSNCVEEWINIIKKYTDKYEITPNDLTISSDASAYQTALKIYKENNAKDYDLVWFLHTQGTKSNRHEVRENHLKSLLYENNNVIEIFKEDNLLGGYGRTITPLPNCWVNSEWDYYLSRFGVEFINRPIRCFLVGTMFIIRGNILDNFIYKCNDSFFNEILHNPHTNGLGDPWFFERDFIHIVDGFTNHYIKGEYVINNYGIPLNGMNDSEHFEKLLSDWKIKNNLNDK